MKAPEAERSVGVDLVARIEFAIVEVLNDTDRQVHVGAVRITRDPDPAILHEGQGADPPCCGDRVVVVPIRSIERIDVFPSLGSLTAGIAEDGLSPPGKVTEERRPEIA